MQPDRDTLIRLDKQYVWHPYTPMRRYIDDVDPLVIARAEGARLHDVDGKSYIDANSSWWVATLGHNHPRLVEALRRQAETMCHVSLAGVTHQPAAELGEALVKAAPRGLSRVFYSDNGSTAVEVAIKLAIQYWRNVGRPEKRRFVALEGAFHGETLGATSLCGVEVFRRPFAGAVMECLFVPPPSPEEPRGLAHEKAFKALEEALAQGRSEIAAVVLEPLVQGSTGMRMYDPELLRRARALCDAHEVLLVIDEVFTGYGRTGGMWACASAGVTPDVMCVGKGFTGGMLPMAATLVKETLFEAFLAPENTFYYGHSFCGNPLGAAVALEVLRVFEEEQILAHAAPKAARIKQAFEEMGQLPGVSNARALGMIGALDLRPGASYLGDLGWRAYAEARRLGVYLRPLGDVIYVAPPLTIAEEVLDELLEVVRRSVLFALGQG
ncbi:adenosylmethionine--8-amino-7-oxononanoate transaminase [Chondromyces apiculatus]|uniref:Adenosylmethionine-8-amino-7-oxononanoate aminotransferase n=1 Tax=Chondromyces apiculatus DSM 436 TaxID=1192034 RepID=A0A017T855_9BACT|nr:adenosylmethionine--8-amino-7-oxononanoate transaminase [Chondromyces apiculatus]EYF04781.1 Adenosylmethionine-8-amino-7-oxononanoate aminotransferase [Chondromyces apiculatus DSM 436]